MNLEEFIKKSFNPNKYGNCFRNRIYCNDGFNMSVQGSSGHYCIPRKTQDWYLSMEIGYPSDIEKLILEYAEDVENPLETVYGYVPCDIIQSIIENHGGIDLNKTIL
jgi:hypothetical protein